MSGVLAHCQIATSYKCLDWQQTGAKTLRRPCDHGTVVPIWWVCSLLSDDVAWGDKERDKQQIKAQPIDFPHSSIPHQSDNYNCWALIMNTNLSNQASTAASLHLPQLSSLPASPTPCSIADCCELVVVDGDDNFTDFYWFSIILSVSCRLVVGSRSVLATFSGSRHLGESYFGCTKWAFQTHDLYEYSRYTLTSRATCCPLAVPITPTHPWPKMSDLIRVRQVH